MTVLHILFYLFSAAALVSAVNVVLARNPVRSVLSLVITFFAMAGNWMLLHAEFLSLILIVVYVGAVMTLFLFVIMMLSVDRESKRGGFVRYLPFGIALSLLLVGLLIVAVGPDYFGLTQMPTPPLEAADYSNTAVIGMLLFTDYVYPFEIAGVLLLAAIIAAITLANRAPLRRKIQNIADQVGADPASRVRLVNMPSEPRQSQSKREE